MNPNHSAKNGSDPERSRTLEWITENALGDQLFAEVGLRERRRRHRQRGAIVVAFSIAAVAAAGHFKSLSRSFSSNSVALVHLPAKRTLPDGSVVELKDQAKIAVQFTDQVRRIELTDGEAMFDVAQNPLRPFIVTAKGVEIRAVGTTFAVRLAFPTVEVVVSDGAVAVTSGIEKKVLAAGSKSLEDQAVVLVPKGNQIVVDLSSELPAALPVTPLSSLEIENRLSWRVPRLELVGSRLDRVVSLFNEHARARLVLGDATLSEIELSGVMRADNTDSLLRLLRDEFGIRTEQHGDEIVLRR